IQILSSLSIHNLGNSGYVETPSHEMSDLHLWAPFSILMETPFEALTGLAKPEPHHHYRAREVPIMTQQEDHVRAR
ncbi:hypothetical protein AB4144_62875, partial [Rhizobiaceae sp. 2RAB30]